MIDHVVGFTEMITLAKMRNLHKALQTFLLANRRGGTSSLITSIASTDAIIIEMPKHNALWDAKVIRDCYNKLMAI